MGGGTLGLRDSPAPSVTTAPAHVPGWVSSRIHRGEGRGRGRECEFLTHSGQIVANHTFQECPQKWTVVTKNGQVSTIVDSGVRILPQ